MCCSPARDLPQLSSSSGNSLASEMMESESPPRTSPPPTADDAEVLSQRTSPVHGEAQGTAKTAPGGNASAAENMGDAIPMETYGGDPDQSGPQPNTIPETHVAPESSEQPPSKEGGAPTLAASSTNPEAPNTLMEALRHASIVEEHPTLMGVVVEKV